MKNIIKYIFIGIIQGLTEFLPISSSGHIVLFGSLFELDNLLLVSIVAHVGTLFSVIFYYRKRLRDLIIHPLNKTNINLIIATIPTVVIAIIFKSFLTDSFKTSTLIWGFLISAIFLVIADLKKEDNKYLNKKYALCMGVSQGLALLPGISRSGTTLVCGLLLGINKKEVLDFSFLMSIPVIIGSCIFEIVDLINCQVSINFLSIFLVLISSFIFGLLSIKFMLKIVKNNKLYYFSFYLIILSLLLLLFA